MQGHRQREAHVLLAAGPHHLLTEEAGVGPQGEFAGSSRRAHSGMRLGDEARSPLGGVSGTAAQAGVHDLARFG